jgi:LEA14-like dessication related protein
MNKKVFIIGSLLLGAAATAWWVKNQITLMGKIRYSVKSYTVKSISTRGIVVVLNMTVKNKGAFEIDVTGYDMDIYGDGNFLIRAVSNQEVKIKPFSETILPVDLIINPKLLLQGIGGTLSGASDWKSIYLEMRGSVKVRKGIIPFPVPIKYGYTLKEIAEW